MQPDPSEPLEKTPQPIFNVPRIIPIVLGLVTLVHLYRLYVLDHVGKIEFLYYFAFIPARISDDVHGIFADWTSIWTLLSYSFLHGDWTHIIVNSIWMLAFGSVVARRFGVVRFLAFCAAGSICGAIAHFFVDSQSLVPMIGASAVVSACMGASVRFAFPMGGRFGAMAHRLPAQSLSSSLRNRQALAFVCIWFVINLFFGLGGELVSGEGQSIAWQAHIGGFLLGFLCFGLFDAGRNAAD